VQGREVTTLEGLGSPENFAVRRLVAEQRRNRAMPTLI